MDARKYKVGKTIKMLRDSKNMSQEDLAAKLNVTRQTISSWENGRTQPDLEIISTIATLFDITIDKLAYGPIEPKINGGNNQKMLWIGLTVALSIVHIVMSLLGKINTVAAFISVVFASFA
ncbi:MAG: helix-turn-helix transcriptional regulator, partial [Eubacteriales bacterium]|nr:helix-turn-helix transcriptional regulator [Eubacteriales bacterium]